MYLNAIKYKGVWLAPGSECKALYDEWKKHPSTRSTKENPSAKDKLDKLMDDIDKAKRKLEGLK